MSYLLKKGTNARGWIARLAFRTKRPQRRDCGLRIVSASRITYHALRIANYALRITRLCRE
ncbi:hypothetical protein CG403_05340 [Gardnerella vaginalis]|nr:hypothetical protein CG403_05340 [Gardnerella vaginalis]